ncbi:PBS lyase [Pseudomonas sp. SWRI111]|uniref:HEAT repeat domain-containing protein n=1 Tax=Pseudomonas sp. SWRI111 TaxID=2745507 RepID=UPI0016474E56|nr:PBS lyase [Pseudomonas sp. SWRI111]MBC3205662.1 PBS lyase [Pseudomonas sp. SWRI111]
MNTTQDWLARLARNQGQLSHYENYRRNEALEILAHFNNTGTWADVSNHSNGFVREVAVRELCRQPSSEALAVLIERLNDWVPQVRDLAAEGLKHYLSPAHTQAWLSALEPLIALAAQRRVDHAQTLSTVRAMLQSVDCWNEVYADLLNRQGKAARYLFTLLLEAPEIPETLIRSALAHRELTVRLMAVSASLTLPATQSLPLLLDAMSRPGAKIRVRVLYALLPLLSDPKPVLREALIDASPAVRNLALWAAPRNDVDAHAFLTERLSQPLPASKQHWLGVLGLATELAVDLPERWHTPALRSTYVTVRQAATRLLRDDQLPELFEALNDPSEKVFAVAIAQLDKVSWPLLRIGLMTKLDTDWHELTLKRRRAIFGLVPTWQQLGYLLECLDTGHAGQTYWLGQIDAWCDRQYLVVDPVTPKTDRAAWQEKLRELTANGQIRWGTRLS